MSVQSSGTGACSNCYRLFSQEEKSYGYGRFPINCIRCAADSIFRIAGYDKQELRSLPICQGIMPLCLPDFHVELIDRYPNLQEHLIQKIISLVDSVFDRPETPLNLKGEATKIREKVIGISHQIELDSKRAPIFRAAKGEALIQIIKRALSLKKIASELPFLREKANNEARALQSRSISTNIARGMQKPIEDESPRQNPANPAAAAVSAIVPWSSKAEAAAAAVLKAVQEREKLQQQHSANAVASYRYDPMSLHLL